MGVSVAWEASVSELARKDISRASSRRLGASGLSVSGTLNEPRASVDVDVGRRTLSSVGTFQLRHTPRPVPAFPIGSLAGRA